MSKVIKGVFISDLHLPYNINLSGVFDYIRDFKPDTIILGGDIIDAADTHGIDGFTPERIEKEVLKVLYPRDVKLMRDLVAEVKSLAPKAKLVFLEGNHEERYRRLIKRYPEMLAGKLDFKKDALSEFDIEWIPYGDYDSFYRVGDTLFTHGTIYPEVHAKKYAYFYSPDKVVYGHVHDFQAFTMHRGDPSKPAKYAVTAGCLCKLTPDYKKGAPHKWNNGFVSFVCQNGITVPTAHLIEAHGFNVGSKMYRGAK
jgi:predicted phosphodiesterase